MVDLTPEECLFLTNVLNQLTFNIDGLSQAVLARSIREKLQAVPDTLVPSSGLSTA